MKSFAARSTSESLRIQSQHAVWQVKSIHDEYLNLSTPEGIITFVKKGNPLIPFGIEVDLELNWHCYDIQEKDPVFQFPNKLVIGQVLTVSGYNQCPRFICHPEFESRYDEAELAQRLESIYQLCLTSNKQGGILTYHGKCAPPRGLQGESWFINSYEKIWSSFETLVRGIRSNNNELIRDGVCGLLGVGQGLTPSGDDFLLGFLCGLREIGVGRYLAASEKMAHQLLANAPLRTTMLSTEYIKHAVEGFYHQRIIDFIEAFNMGSTSDMLEKADRLMALGHFSGTDVMMGFVYGARTALRAELPKSTD